MFAMNSNSVFAFNGPSISTSRYITGYAVGTGKVYTSSSLSVRGTSSPYRRYNASVSYHDQIYIYSITDRYAKIKYPTSSGWRIGYVPTSCITRNNRGSYGLAATVRSKNNINVYKWEGGGKIGSIYKNDYVYVLARSGSYTQVIYPAGSVYKIGFITNSDYTNKLVGSSSSGSSVSVVSVNNGAYMIYAGHTQNKVADVYGNRNYDGANVSLYDANGSEAQIFYITSLGNGWYKITNKNGKALDVAGGVAKPSTNVQMYSWNGTYAQQWRFLNAGNGYYNIQNRLGCVLDVYGEYTHNCTNIQVYTRHNNNNQKWKLVPVSGGGNQSNTMTALSYGLYKKSSAYISCGFDGYKNTKGRHEGIDFQGGNGSPIYNLVDGVVVRVAYGCRGSRGLSTIAIYDSASNKTVVYLHAAPEGLYEGKSVKKGDYIGKQDWRGCSSASGGHTHVEVVNGRTGYANKSVNDYVLSNQNPASYWNSKGYSIK